MSDYVEIIEWCGRLDLNQHALRHTPLKRALTLCAHPQNHSSSANSLGSSAKAAFLRLVPKCAHFVTEITHGYPMDGRPKHAWTRKQYRPFGGVAVAKRWTDTEKWKKVWFSELEPEAKLAWLYILDECDNAGIWPANFRRMSADLGFQVDRSRFDAWFRDRTFQVGQEKYFLPSFIPFQQKATPDKLNPSNHAHKKILEILDGEGLLGRSPEGLPEVSRRSSMEPPKEASMEGPCSSKVVVGSGRVVEGGAGETKPKVSRDMIEACKRTWLDTLQHFKTGRTALGLKEETLIARAITEHGAEFVDLALYGARFEPATDQFKPAEHVSLTRVLFEDRNGKIKIDRFVNLGSQARSKRAAKAIPLPQVEPAPELPPADPERVRELLASYGFGKPPKGAA
jgi:hypothetical protein